MNYEIRKELHELIPKTEQLCALAEEASELAQAALKLRRVLDGTNPTTRTYEEARANLVEEAADVYCILGLILNAEDHAEIYNTINRKTKRWTGRIKEARGDSDASIR